MIRRPYLYLAAVLLLAGASPTAKGVFAGSGVDFQRDVQPILRRHCHRCHGSKTQEGGLQLNRRDSAWGVGDSQQPIIVKHRADESLLMRRLVSSDDGDAMPRDAAPLASAEIEILRSWIQQGAVWPDELAEPRHWAFQPIGRPDPPAAGPNEANVGPIDRFLRRRLSEAGLAPSPAASRARQLRRVALALTGLPPTPVESQAFERDATPDAYEQAVDRLLASPRYGERWSIPWLDLARYADSNGFQADQLRDNWAYRDWVIRSLNADMPFDQFVIDQLAGDLCPDATTDQRIATGFHRMTTCNVEAGVDPEANRIDQVIDRVNTTATVFMGVTLECAQCHDHKYDPFTQHDYYRFFAYFNNTPIEVKHTSGVTYDFYGPTMELPRAPADQRSYEVVAARLAKLKSKHEQTTDDNLREEIKEKIAQVEAKLEQLAAPSTLVMQELNDPRPTYVLARGDYSLPGDRVEPGTPAVLPTPQGIERTGDRLELARWLTSRENPLLARVTVNRWWAELFGRGLVATPEDFGAQAEDPSHAELLDWLASQLIDSGWSTKHVLRLIVTSAAFRQQAGVTSELLNRDPHNRLLGRGPRFRMPAELIRDNALAISGLLSTEMYGPPIMPHQPAGIWRSVGRNQPEWEAANDSSRYRRGVYVIWKRAAPYPSLVTFDAPNRGSCTVGRPRTNTPLQALTLLNDPAYAEAALGFADRILTAAPVASDEVRLRYAVRAALARQASTRELTVLQQLLDEERAALAENPLIADERVSPSSEAMRIQTSDKVELAAWFAVANALLNLDETLNF